MIVGSIPTAPTINEVICLPYIYKITNGINGKSYIGKTMFAVNERWKEHCNDYQKNRCDNRPLYKAMRKYGIENFSVEEIEKCTDDILSERKIYWINYYDTYRNGYNATVGGDGAQYIDYDLVVRIYELTRNQKETARIVGIDISTVKNILRTRNVDIIPSNQVINDVCGKSVGMISKNGELIKSFESASEAARYVLKTTDMKLISGAAAHISSVCNGKRKTAYHYKWSHL